MGNKVSRDAAIEYATMTLQAMFDCTLTVNVADERCLQRTAVTFHGLPGGDGIGSTFNSMTVRANIDYPHVEMASDNMALGRWLVCQALFFLKGDPIEEFLKRERETTKS